MRALGLWPTPASEQSEPGRPSDPGGASNTSGVDGATGPGGPRGSAQDRLRAVAERLLALQGQDWNASRWALGVRATGTVDADVLAAFDSGALVRSWPMRGTIHVLAAEDLGWMQAATNHRTLPGAPKRRAFIGLDDASLARMVDIAVERLTGGRSLSRDELGQAWTEAGIGTSEQGVGPWRYHVVWWLCQNGITVPGPVNGTPGERAAASGDAHADAYAYAYADADDPAGTGRERAPEPRLVLAEEWITNPRKLEGEEALAELAARFARGRGPVQAKDLAWWTGLTLREVRRGIAAAIDDGRLVEVEIEGSPTSPIRHCSTALWEAR
ncbi:winged helix DNA-binding domain-containing protein [Leucobacter soli]|uniref:winged helix DNA-binding domain-containing protein n=1 Tax=Leucobacter soli TaxID=2812850 RepID=UPI0036092413